MGLCKPVLLAVVPMTSIALSQDRQPEKPPDGPLMTRWATDVRPDVVWPEYPRPQLVRADWLSLNGLWDYAVTPAGHPPRQYDGKILVPFCAESALSGVQKAVQPNETLWYHREFDIPETWAGQNVLLHFGAVDWATEVRVNGKSVGRHQGGYDPFTFDVTHALAPSGPQKLVVKVTDPTDTSWQPRGKQVLNPQGIWYTAVTGIWQTVWLEPVHGTHIRALKITPDVDHASVQVETIATGDGQVEVAVLDTSRHVVAEATGQAGREIILNIPNPRLWSPQSPHLYNLTVRLRHGGDILDTVHSYFGMRKVSLGEHNGLTRILINDQPLFQFGPLDQGWWPDGLYTAPTDAALRHDPEQLKKLGMNMLRKHVKIEPARFYYHCDQLGLLVWQDMPSGDAFIGGGDPDIKRTSASGQNFERELKAMIDSLGNHPSIIMWVVYNEGWGQWDTSRITRWVKTYDPTRLVDAASGWTDRGVGDVIDIHAYPGPSMAAPEPNRASVLGEFGGLGWPVKDHLWRNQHNWGYRSYLSRQDLQQHYTQIVQRLWPMIGQGLSAAVYTQTSDVETEVNGLMTYDRAVLKLDPEPAASLHQTLYRPPPRIETVVPTSETKPQTWRYTVQAPADHWTKPEFDDSQWRSGPGMFGREGTPGVHVGTPWTTKDIWLRREFQLADVPPPNVYLRVYHDEDAEVYLNGVLAGSFNRWVTGHILSQIADDAYRALRKGKNVMAVHCRQTTGGQGVDVGLCLVVGQPRGD